MKLLYPDFLFALLALAIPIIIHLFNFRRFKKVYFSNVAFLKEIKQETQSRSRIKHWLILFARLLAVTFLVLAFAQPYLPNDEQQQVAGQSGVSVYLDNSFSMDAVSAEGRAFELGKQYAYEIANSFANTDAYQILTNDFEGRHYRLTNQADFGELVDEVNISPAVRKLSEVIERQSSTLANKETADRSLFVISDFQASISDFEALKADSSVRVNLIPITPAPTPNLFVDSVWFENPVHQVNAPQELSVRIRNRSDEAITNVPIKLLINGNQKSLASANIPAGATIDTVLVFTPNQPGIQQGEVRISDYPINFDDHYFFAYNISAYVDVLSIGLEADSTGFIPRLFRNDPFFQVTHAAEGQLDYSRFQDFQVIILSGLNVPASGLAQELRKFVSDGGSLLVFPGPQADLKAYGEFLQSMDCDQLTSLDTAKTSVTVINNDHPIFFNVFESIPRNIDLPEVFKHYPLTNRVNTNRENLFELRNGTPFVASYRFGRGRIFLSTVPADPEFSNFPRHAVFVPAVYNAALFSQVSGKLSYTIGEDEIIELERLAPGPDQVLKLRSQEDASEVIPEQRNSNFKTSILVHNQIETAGNYMLTDGTADLRGLAFNYPREESELQTLSAEEIEQKLAENGLFNFSLLDSDYQTLRKDLEDISRGTHYWRWCILLVLLFLGLEIALIKLL